VPAVTYPCRLEKPDSGAGSGDTLVEVVILITKAAVKSLVITMHPIPPIAVEALEGAATNVGAFLLDNPFHPIPIAIVAVAVGLGEVADAGVDPDVQASPNVGLETFDKVGGVDEVDIGLGDEGGVGEADADVAGSTDIE